MYFLKKQFRDRLKKMTAEDLQSSSAILEESQNPHQDLTAHGRLGRSEMGQPRQKLQSLAYARVSESTDGSLENSIEEKKFDKSR